MGHMQDGYKTFEGSMVFFISSLASMKFVSLVFFYIASMKNAFLMGSCLWVVSRTF